jgi:DNA-binding Xre family transcriptional regulator
MEMATRVPLHKTKSDGQRNQKAAIPVNQKFVEWRLNELGITYQDVVRMTHLSPTTVHRVVKGGPWTDSTLDLLAKALQCNPHDLISARAYADPLVDAPATPNYIQR